MKRRDVLSGLASAAAAGSIISAAGAQTVPPAAQTRSPARKVAQVAGATVLVTGSNRGIGLGFVKALLARGVKRVYATARNPDNLADVVTLDSERVVPLALDVNEPTQREAAATTATDVTWLINNAGVAGSGTPTERRIRSATSLENARFVMETNCWSPAELARLFIPIILNNSGGAIVNILSVGAWYCVPEYATYSMSKAAAAMMTAGLRAELDRDPVLVSGVFTAGVATRMSSGRGMLPVDHAHQVFEALAHGETDILAGSGVARLRDEVRSDPKAVERSRIERFYASESALDERG